MIDLAVLKQRLTDVEGDLDRDPMVPLLDLETPAGLMTVIVTARLRDACRRGKTWKSRAMLTALKNAQYGLVPTRSRSRGGADGVFLLDRDFTPANEMMRKIFGRFIDKPDPLVASLSARFGVAREALVAVRVVSHQMRLLGVLVEARTPTLVLVDYDDT